MATATQGRMALGAFARCFDRFIQVRLKVLALLKFWRYLVEVWKVETRRGFWDVGKLHDEASLLDVLYYGFCICACSDATEDIGCVSFGHVLQHIEQFFLCSTLIFELLVPALELTRLGLSMSALGISRDACSAPGFYVVALFLG